jgi:hypothetical protein
VAALVWTVSTVVRPAIRAGDGLVARYYPNTEWAGQPIHVGTSGVPSTAQLGTPWGGVAPSSFSVRWTGYLSVRRAALYRFSTTSDDASWLFVDGRPVVDNGGVHGPQTRSGEIELAEGPHQVRLDYVQFGGESALAWSWAVSGESDVRVPSWALSSRRAPNAAVMAVRAFDLGILGLGVLIALVGVPYVGVKLAPVLLATIDAASDLVRRHRRRVALGFSVFAYAVLLFLPTGGWGLLDAVVATTRRVNGSVIAMTRHVSAFQSNINTPRAGEQQVLPPRVLAMVAMLERHGLSRYQLSDAVAADEWSRQQMIASAWPRTNEPDANARFVLNGEPVHPGCTVLDSRKDVSLVYCP